MVTSGLYAHVVADPQSQRAICYLGKGGTAPDFFQIAEEERL
ncbi:MAG: hypothetical protein AABY92_03620 [Thermodesulfobacteriota bacterium]